MIKLNYLFDKIRDVKVTDYLSFFPMTLALLLKPFYRKKYTRAWLVCEEPEEARDNGYHFFKYMCINQPQQKCFYAIKKKSVDAKKVEKYGEIIEYGSISHWIAYFLCEYNISSQKGGKPNAAVCSFMELNGFFHPQNIFLQHGVIINNLKWLYAEKSCISKFITSTYPETEFIKKNFGYDSDSILLTGLPRFDNLHDLKIKDNRILIMPTWRYWFNLKSKQGEMVENRIEDSEYLTCWLELLNSPRLQKLIDKNKLEVIFYPHRNMQKYLESFTKVKSKVIIASWKDYDIQELLKSSSMMITDYSSVFFDMVYMKKPVIFFQFDEEKYRNYQYGEGYFDYHNNFFGNSCPNVNDVLSELEKIIERGFKPQKEFLEEHKRIFKYWDNKNSQRIFQFLVK